MPTQREAFFEKDPDTNATQRIVTVAIYLQARCDAMRCAMRASSSPMARMQPLRSSAACAKAHPSRAI